jgi:iron complex transport system substrate-binding protein
MPFALESPTIVPYYGEVQKSNSTPQVMSSSSTLLLFFVLKIIPRLAFSQVSGTDDLGRSIVLEGPAHRIVSLAPSITETLFALGAGDRVVGVTDYCNYPEEAKTKPSVGGIINPSMEAIVGLTPDLVILSTEGNLRDDFIKIESLGIRVFVTDPRTLAGIRKSVLDLGALSGTSPQAQQIVQSMQEQEEAIRSARLLRRQGLMLVSLQPIMAVGTGTYLAEVLALAGIDNVAADASVTYPSFSREAVIAANPEVIIMTSDISVSTDELLRIYPEWRTLRAFKMGRIFSIDADLVTRPGPRIMQGAGELRRMLW